MSELEIKHPDFAKRLNLLMDKKNIDKNTLSGKTGISYEMIRRYCEGFAKPRSKSLKKISDALGTSSGYLDYGETPEDLPTIDDLKAQIKSMQGSELLDASNKDPEGTQRVSLSHAMNGMLPVISWVAAGSFSEVLPVTIDDVIEWIPRPPHLSARAFGLIVQGRSMWPEFKPAEIIYVEPEINPWDLRDGDLVVIHCTDDKQATFKQLIMGDGSEDMYLKPLNPEWPEQKIIPMGECTLVGVVDSKYVRYRKPKQSNHEAI